MTSQYFDLTWTVILLKCIGAVIYCCILFLLLVIPQHCFIFSHECKYRGGVLGLRQVNRAALCLAVAQSGLNQWLGKWKASCHSTQTSKNIILYNCTLSFHHLTSSSLYLSVSHRLHAWLTPSTSNRGFFEVYAKLCLIFLPCVM